MCTAVLALFSAERLTVSAYRWGSSWLVGFLLPSSADNDPACPLLQKRVTNKIFRATCDLSNLKTHKWIFDNLLSATGLDELDYVYDFAVNKFEKALSELESINDRTEEQEVMLPYYKNCQNRKKEDVVLNDYIYAYQPYCKYKECEDKIWVGKRYYLNHMISEHESGVFECKYDGCNEEFLVFHQLRVHVRVKHNQGGYFYICPKCLCIILSEEDVKRHDDSRHDQNKPRKCDKCGFTFTRKDSLTRHIKDKNCKRQ